MKKAYNITVYEAYCNQFRTEKQYAVYEDVEGQLSSRMAALFGDRDEAQAYADMKNDREAQNG